MSTSDALPLTQPQAAVLVATLVTTSMLSVVGSVSVIWMTSRKLRVSQYHRLAFGLSVADLLFCGPMMLNPFLVAERKWPWAVGNNASCAAVGFFTIVGPLLSACYHLFLSFHFFRIIRADSKQTTTTFTNTNNTTIAALWREAGLWLHVGVVTVALALGIEGLASQSFNTYGYVCSLTEIPIGCLETGDCERGASNEIIGWIFAGIMMVTTILSTGATLAVYRAVRLRYHRKQRFKFMWLRQQDDDEESSGEINNNKRKQRKSILQATKRQQSEFTACGRHHQSSHLRQASHQATLYLLAYLNSFLTPLVLTIVICWTSSTVTNSNTNAGIGQFQPLLA